MTLSKLKSPNQPLKIERWRRAIWDEMGFSVHPGQVRLMNVIAEYDRVLGCMGRRDGKSVGISKGIIYPDTVAPPGCLVRETWPAKTLIIAPRQEQAEILFRPAYDLLKAKGVPLVRDRGYGNKLEVVTAYGSVIKCLTGKSPTGARGWDWTRVVADELAFFDYPEMIDEVILPSLIDHGGQFIGITTPDAPGSYAHSLAMKGMNPDDVDWGYAHSTTYDNWFIKNIEQKLEQLKRQLPEDVFAREVLAEWRARTGLVFKNYLDCVKEFTVPEGAIWYRTIDWGFENPFACLCVAYAGDRLYVWDEYYYERRSLEQHAVVFRNMDHQIDIHYNLADPADPRSIIDFANLRPRVKGAWIRNYKKGNIVPTIDLLRRCMENDRVWIHPRCTNLITEGGKYRYPKKSEMRNFTENPIDKDNHGWDALRYLTEHLFRNKIDIGTLISMDWGEKDSIAALVGYN